MPAHCYGVRPGASRQSVAGGPGRTRTNREEIKVRSYIPGSATDQTHFGAKRDPGIATICASAFPEVLRCVPVRSDTPRLCPGHRRQSQGSFYGESRK